MTIEILKDDLTRRPFEPFRIVTSSGQAYEVRHPENAILIRGGIVIAHGGGNGDLPESAATLSLMHISSIEALRSGARRRR